MDIRKLQRAIVDGLEDVKAQDIQVFNTEHLSPLFERVIVASGSSNRQTKALAASVRDAVKSRGLSVMRTEGEDNGEWIIVDCGAAVAHIMQPAIRQYYHLEELWGGKAVKMKVGEAKVGLVKAEEPASKRRAAAPSGTPGSRPAAPARPAAKKAAPGGSSARPSASGRSAPGRPAAPKSASAKSASARSAPGKTAARSSASKTSAARPAPKAATAPASRSAPTRSPIGRPVAKKAAAKKAAPAASRKGGTRRP
ncbi:MAG: ribosome silencing factor [Burkholderiaceae bacterium]